MGQGSIDVDKKGCDPKYVNLTLKHRAVERAAQICVTICPIPPVRRYLYKFVRARIRGRIVGRGGSAGRGRPPVNKHSSRSQPEASRPVGAVLPRFFTLIPVCCRQR